MKRDLRRDFRPPAPVVPIEISAPAASEAKLLDGKIDTGADLCGVPHYLVAALDLPRVRVVRASGFSGAAQEVVVYGMDLEIDGLVLPQVEAVAIRQPYALIGRNVLQHLVLRVDGPKETVELKRPRAR